MPKEEWEMNKHCVLYHSSDGWNKPFSKAKGFFGGKKNFLNSLMPRLWECFWNRNIFFCQNRVSWTIHKKGKKKLVLRFGLWFDLFFWLMQSFILGILFQAIVLVRLKGPSFNNISTNCSSVSRGIYCRKQLTSLFGNSLCHFILTECVRT